MAHLLLRPDTASPERIELKEGTLAIGRSRECGLALADGSLSRKHAELHVEGRRHVLVDLASRNGTFVNGNRVQRCELENGDHIQLGDVPLVFLASGSDYRQLPAPGPAAAETSLQEMLSAQPADAECSLRIEARDPTLRQRARLEILLSVSRLLSTPMALDLLLQRILDLLFQIVAIDRAALLLRADPTDVEATGADPWCVRVGDAVFRPQVLKPERVEGTLAAGGRFSRRVVQHVVRHKVTVLSRSAQEDERFAEDEPASIRAQSIQSVMAAPLVAAGKVIGAIYADNVRRKQAFSEEDLEFLSAFAAQASLAIENHELRRDLEAAAVRRSSLLRFFPPQAVEKLEVSGGMRLGAVETEATLLFSDISGFTDMSSTMRPQEVVELLNEYFPVMAAIVFKHGGTLEKYIGDALLAVWGAPFTTGDDAGASVRAAVDMLRELRTLNERFRGQGRREVQVHIGINTGVVAAGNIGSESYIQYATIGDPTNVASRICSAAGSGELFISSRTRESLKREEFPLEALPPVSVKGKTEPLDLYRVRWDG